MYRLVKIQQGIHLRSIHFVICKLYLNLKKNEGAKISEGAPFSQFYILLYITSFR